MSWTAVPYAGMVRRRGGREPSTAPVPQGLLGDGGRGDGAGERPRKRRRGGLGLPLRRSWIDGSALARGGLPRCRPPLGCTRLASLPGAGPALRRSLLPSGRPLGGGRPPPRRRSLLRCSRPLGGRPLTGRSSLPGCSLPGGSHAHLLSSVIRTPYASGVAAPVRSCRPTPRSARRAGGRS